MALKTILPYPEGDPTLPGMFAWARNLVQQLQLALGSNEGENSESSTLPAGVILATAGAVPAGWLACDGTVRPRAAFPALFKAIGTKFNTGGESADEFRLPNGDGRVARGSASAYGGANSVTLAQANLPNANCIVTDPGHSHTFTGEAHDHGVSDAGHSHTMTGTALSVGGSVNVGGGSTSIPGGAGGAIGVQSATTGIVIQTEIAGGSNSNDATGISVSLGGDGTPVETVPAFFGVTWIIKT